MAVRHLAKHYEMTRARLPTHTPRHERRKVQSFSAFCVSFVTAVVEPVEKGTDFRFNSKQIVVTGRDYLCPSVTLRPDYL